jgi:AcrR family transcriptional regulator
MSNLKGISSTRATRDKILETALKLFSRKGYLGATTKEISKEAGIAEVTLFRHFPSKEKLFADVINTYSFLPALKSLLPEISNMPYQDALTVIARKFLETLTARKDIIRIMLSEMHRYPEQIQHIYNAFIEELFRTLASYFEELQKKGIAREFNPEFAARAFLGIFFSYFIGMEIKNLKRFKKEDTETLIKEFVSLFINGILRRRI